MGVSESVQKQIEEWLEAKIQAKSKTTYEYSAKYDGFSQYPPTQAGKYRAPRSNKDFARLGYFQHQCRALLRAVQEVMPGPEAVRLARNFQKCLVAIDASGNQGLMSSRSDGTSVMTVNVEHPVAKTHNIIAHEMAHCALSPKREAGMTTVHNDTHTALWKRFVQIGIDKLGWEFVEFTYPNCCEKYNICDLREFDQTVVYNNARGQKSYGAKLVRWAD